MSTIPVITEVVPLAIWAKHRGQPVTNDELLGMCASVGRNGAPELLMYLHEWGMLSPEAYLMTGDIWSSSEFPDRYLRRGDWLALFRAAGFTVDGVPAEPPAEPLTLYRGSVPERRKDWSWTDDLEVATKYASGDWFSRPKGSVWVATVPPERLLAQNLRRKESEYVVYTRGLKIEEYVA